MYTNGYSVRTTIDPFIQQKAEEALIQGLEDLDQRQGWRGPIINKKNSDNWNTNLKKYKLEKTIGWDLAIIEKINKFSVEIETENKVKGKIEYKDISWTKKEFEELLKNGIQIKSNKKQNMIINQSNFA